MSTRKPTEAEIAQREAKAKRLAQLAADREAHEARRATKMHPAERRKLEKAAREKEARRLALARGPEKRLDGRATKTGVASDSAMKAFREQRIDDLHAAQRDAVDRRDHRTARALRRAEALASGRRLDVVTETLDRLADEKDRPDGEVTPDGRVVLHDKKAEKQ